jgi:hypothetical protein
MSANWWKSVRLRKPQLIAVVDRRSGAVIGSAIRVADTALARMVGLLGNTGLAPGSGLLLAPCSGVHTLGMAFAIDVVAVDRQWRVRRLWPELPPGRFAGVSWKAYAMLELPAGAIRESGVAVGDELELRESSA